MHPTIQLVLQEIERLGIKKWEFICQVADILGRECSQGWRKNAYRYITDNEENRVIPRPKIIAAMQKWLDEAKTIIAIEE